MRSSHHGGLRLRWLESIVAVLLVLGTSTSAMSLWLPSTAATVGCGSSNGGGTFTQNGNTSSSSPRRRRTATMTTMLLLLGGGWTKKIDRTTTKHATAESSNNTVRTITEDVETAVATVWERSRRWSFLATTKKRRVHCWRLVALVCSVAGAIFQALARCFPQDTRILATQNVLNFVGASLLAVAPYLITSFCGRDKVRDWIRCRAAADDLQSHTYLYRMGVQPYDHPPEKMEDGALHTFLMNMAIISESVQDMNHEYIVTYQNNNTTMNTIDDDTTTLTPPPANLDRESYLHDRIDHQIHHHYIHAATIYATRSRYLHRGMATLSFLAATVGFITGYVPPLKNYVGLSTALTLAATSIGTHIAASGYDSRAETLSTSALHLETLRLGLPHSVHVGSTEWRTFVVQCEQHMASTTRRVGAAANVTTLQRLDSTSHRPNTIAHSRLNKVE